MIDISSWIASPLLIQYAAVPELPLLVDPVLISQCTTHNSWWKEKREVDGRKGVNPSPYGQDAFWRLAWLGKSLIDSYAAQFLLERYPQAAQASFIGMKAAIGSVNILSYLSRHYRLHERLRVGPSIASQGMSQNLCSDIFLAYIGALHQGAVEQDAIRLWLWKLWSTETMPGLTKLGKKEKVKKAKLKAAHFRRLAGAKPKNRSSESVKQERSGSKAPTQKVKHRGAASGGSQAGYVKDEVKVKKEKT